VPAVASEAPAAVPAAPETSTSPKTTARKGSLKQSRSGAFPTVDEIQSDPLTAIADKFWSPALEMLPEFDGSIVEKVFTEDIEPAKNSRLVLLEFSCYLERYLWPNFDAEESTDAHVLSIMAMVNEKIRENVDAFSCFEKRPDTFPSFFDRVLKMRLQESMSLKLKTIHTIFMMCCFASLENSLVRDAALKMVALDCWLILSPGRRELELRHVAGAGKYLGYLDMREKEGAATSLTAAFIPNLLKEFTIHLAEVGVEGPLSPEMCRYLERFVEFTTDLLSQLPTRRFFLAIYRDSFMQLKAEMSPLNSRPEGKLFSQLVKIMRFYADFEIDEHTGAALSVAEVASRHGETLSILQRVAFKQFPSLKDLALSNHATIESRAALSAALHPLPSAQLRQLCSALSVMPSVGGEEESDETLREAMIQRHEARSSQLEALSEIPLYPTEDVMWDENIVPAENYYGDSCLALPKINLQFLTFTDYLLRNYKLYRLEACYEIRASLEEVLKHVKPRSRRATYESASNRTLFTGWARMSLEVGNFQVTKVTKPNVGENHPAQVVADLEYSLRDMRGDVRWPPARLFAEGLCLRF
jgi:intron-binding protein aquarius